MLGRAKRVKAPDRSPQGINSIEVGGSLLAALVESTGDMSLTELANVTKMPLSKARRYLLSYTRIGLAEQVLPSRRYGLGPLAIRLGLAALGRIDAVRVGSAAGTELQRRTKNTVVFSVWRDGAPTMVQVEQSAELFTVSLQVGTRLPLLRSAVGRVFAAFLPAAIVKRQIRQELRSPETLRLTRLRTREDVRRLLDEVRRRGAAVARGELVPGLAAVSAPVFDFKGEIAAALALAGRPDLFDTRWDGPNAVAVKQTAAVISSRLGYSGFPTTVHGSSRGGR
jgi:DNA-binding IclR family transcriptional regulator